MWKVIITAKASGLGTLSADEFLTEMPDATALKKLRYEITALYDQVYLRRPQSVDITVRKENS